MAIQSASAQIITTFKSAVVGLRILTTTIIELGSSTNNPIVSNLISAGIRQKGFLAAMSSAFTCQAARNNMPGFLVAGFLNKTALRQGDIFSDNIDLTEANKNYGINLISKATLNIRVPTRVTIDVAKIQIPIINLSSYTIEVEEGFFRQRSVVSTNGLLTNTNNQMPSVKIAPLVTLLTNGRPFWVASNPSNGTTTYVNTKVRLAIFNANNLGSTGTTALNTITPGTGFIRLYREGVLVSTLSCFSNLVSFITNYIEVDYRGLLDANKSYYILIDNGFAIDRDGFATQAVTSTSQITFTTFPSTDPEFPDLVALQMSAANLLLPQSEILILYSAALTSTVGIVANAEEVFYGSGTSEVVASVIADVSKTVKPILTQPILSQVACNAVAVKRVVSNASITTSLVGEGIRIRNESHMVVTATLSYQTIELLTRGNASLTAVSSMVAIGGSPLTMEWNVLNNAESVDGFGRNSQRTINIPVAGNYNLTIVWGDGTTTTHTGYSQYGTLITKTYSSGGTKTVRIFGELDWLGKDFDPLMPQGQNINNSSEQAETIIQGMNQLTKVLSWGDLPLTSIQRAFSGGIRLTQVPNRVPSTVTDCRWTFDGCVLFNHANIVQWNTINITNMRGMFSRTNVFNQPIGVWNVSNVTNMSHMFDNGSAPNGQFNQSLNAWNVSNVTNIDYMFQYQPQYNQSMNSWNTSNVTSMRGVFMTCYSFNGNITSWNTANVTRMWRMFLNAAAFNQNIGSWNTASVGPNFFMEHDHDFFESGSQYSGMGNMFVGASAFNQDISGWCVQQIPTVPTSAYGRGADTFSGATTTFWPLNKRPQWGAVCS